MSANDDKRGVANADSRPPASPSGDVAAFLKAARTIAPRQAGARGRLVFALDATMSRQPTWDMACAIQAEMFAEAARIGALDIQLVFFRGQADCRASGFVAEATKLGALMGKIRCEGGQTQIGRVLEHAIAETDAERVHAVVFVGDACEENVDALCAAAGRLALKSTPMFLFQEGHDPNAEAAFREMARITRGAYARFAPGAAAELASLLRAVAAFASGGRAALTDASSRGDKGARLLIGQMG